MFIQKDSSDEFVIQASKARFKDAVGARESLLSCIARREIWGGDNEFLGRRRNGEAIGWVIMVGSMLH